MTSHFGQLPQVSHNSRATVKPIEAAHNQTTFHGKDAEMEGEGTEGGRPERTFTITKASPHCCMVI